MHVWGDRCVVERGMGVSLLEKGKGGVDDDDTLKERSPTDPLQAHQLRQRSKRPQPTPARARGPTPRPQFVCVRKGGERVRVDGPADSGHTGSRRGNLDSCSLPADESSASDAKKPGARNPTSLFRSNAAPRVACFVLDMVGTGVPPPPGMLVCWCVSACLLSVRLNRSLFPFSITPPRTNSIPTNRQARRPTPSLSSLAVWCYR